LPGVELRIADDGGNPLPQGEIGMIEVRGPNVFTGYWRMPEKTETDSQGGFSSPAIWGPSIRTAISNCGAQARIDHHRRAECLSQERSRAALTVCRGSKSRQLSACRMAISAKRSRLLSSPSPRCFHRKNRSGGPGRAIGQIQAAQAGDFPGAVPAITNGQGCRRTSSGRNSRICMGLKAAPDTVAQSWLLN